MYNKVTLQDAGVNLEKIFVKMMIEFLVLGNSSRCWSSWEYKVQRGSPTQASSHAALVGGVDLGGGARWSCDLCH